MEFSSVAFDDTASLNLFQPGDTYTELQVSVMIVLSNGLLPVALSGDDHHAKIVCDISSIRHWKTHKSMA